MFQLATYTDNFIFSNRDQSNQQTYSSKMFLPLTFPRSPPHLPLHHSYKINSPDSVIVHIFTYPNKKYDSKIIPNNPEKDTDNYKFINHDITFIILL